MVETSGRDWAVGARQIRGTHGRVAGHATIVDTTLQGSVSLR